MSWYFLGGFSAYAIDPSARVVNHSGCSVTQGGRASVERDVEGDLQPLGPRLRDEGREVLLRAEVRVDRVCPPSGEPIAYGQPGSPGWASSVLLRPLRNVVPIGCTGVQVHDVEPHRRDAGQPLRRRRERAGHPRAVLLLARPLRAGEHLVPGARPARAGATPAAAGVGRRDQLAQRRAAQCLGDLGRRRRREPGLRRTGGVGQGAPRGGQGARGAGGGARRRRDVGSRRQIFSNRRTPSASISSVSMSAPTLTPASCTQEALGVPPPLDPEGPVAHGVGRGAT